MDGTVKVARKFFRNKRFTVHARIILDPRGKNLDPLQKGTKVQHNGY